jgi:RNA polymerase sigma-70 factor (ECF subfamily)
VSCNHEHAAYVQHLFERYRTALHRHVGALLGSWADAEDVVQEAYSRLLAFAELEHVDARARSYLFRVATNLAYDRHRRPREHSLDALPGGPDSLAVIDGADGLLDMDRALEALGQALLALRPRSRQVFLLRTAEGLGYDAIGERLGISRRTVEREMKHALDSCQRRLRRSTE